MGEWGSQWLDPLKSGVAGRGFLSAVDDSGQPDLDTQAQLSLTLCHSLSDSLSHGNWMGHQINGSRVRLVNAHPEIHDGLNSVSVVNFANHFFFLLQC